jgi:pyruvate dehydrogenase E2 component (dihydrolipoyllysine-residue acetyltransferase)
MATNVILPALGMAQDTGKIIQWLKAEGDTVREGDFIAEIETDKASIELEAPAAGTLTLVRAAGDDVPVGQTIAIILAAGESAAEIMGAATPASSSAAATQISASNGYIAGGERAEMPLQSPGAQRRLGSPKAKRMAAAQGLDITQITGSGPHGVVLAADVMSAAAQTGEANGAMAPTIAARVAIADETAPTMSRTARLMAERTTQSWTTTPHFYLVREVDASAFKNWYGLARKRSAEKVTYTDLLVKVVATALQMHPQLNATWQNGAVASQQAINVALAVASPDGLVVPVIPHTDELSLTGIARQRADIVERAQLGKLRLNDLQGGTFTISNLGMYGVDAFNAIINSPQAAILAVGALVDRVIPVDGQPAVRPTLTLTLSCDHRVVDGARGAQFLATVAELIADPSGL